VSEDLLEFIEARLRDEESEALAATPGPWRWVDPGGRYKQALTGADGELVAPIAVGDVYPSKYDAAFIARHDPARVLRDIQAKRRLLAEHERVLLHKGAGADHFVTAWVCRTCGGSDASYDDGTPCMRAAKYPCRTLRLLALPFADHPGYDPSWSPADE